MDLTTYQQTPKAITYLLNIFKEHHLNYLLFKCEHIFAGENKNLDILFETEQDYYTAGRLLEQQGFAVRLSERIEKYKTMYTGFCGQELYSIHLHREVAWHGLKA